MKRNDAFVWIIDYKFWLVDLQAVSFLILSIGLQYIAYLRLDLCNSQRRSFKNNI